MVPDTIIHNTYASVELVLANLGANTSSGGTVNVGYYLSSGPTLELESDEKLTSTFKNIQGNDTITYSINRKFSSNLSEAYLFVHVDYENNVPEMNEANNSISFPLYFKERNADPVVRSDSLSGSPAVSGSNITVYSGVDYLGTDTAYSFIVQYYLSEDTIFNEINDYFLDSYTVQDNPANFSNSFQLPDARNGSYHVLTVVDKYNSLDELNENNNVSHLPLTITDPDIDIVVANSSVNEIDTIKTGQAGVEIVVDVYNQGTTAMSGNFNMKIYYSDDQVHDENDQLIDSETINQLAAGVNHLHTLTYNFPEIEKGTYYLLTDLDVNNEIDETNEDNNFFVLPFVVEPRDIDLRFISAELSRNTILSSDYFYVQFEIENGGTEALGSGSYAYTYLSADPFLDVSDVYLDDIYVGDEDPGETSYHEDYTSLEVDVKGTNYIIIHLDAQKDLSETNEANNYTSLPIQIGGFEGGDLSFGDISLNNDTIVPGLLFYPEVTIFNNDSVDTYRSKLSIYLSYDNSFNRKEDDRKVYYSLNAIEGNSQVNVDYTMYWTDDVAPGNYTLFFVLDEDNDQFETNETNNIKGVPFTVLENNSDAIPFFTTIADTIYPGDKISGYVLNNGEGPSISFYSQLFISEDSMLNTFVDDMLTGKYEGFDDSDDSIVVIYDPMISYPSGDYYLILKADRYNVVPELNEENNLAIKKVYFHNYSFDVSLDSLELSETTITSNQYVSIETSLHNNSEKDHGGYQVNTSAYLSTDTLFDYTDEYIYNFSTQLPAPGNSARLNRNVYFNIDENNTYYVLVVTDPYDNLKETNEMNNVAWAQLVYNETGNTLYTDFVINSASVVSNRVEPYTRVEVEYELENTGNQGNGYTHTRIYLSADSVYSGDDVYVGQDYTYNLSPGNTRIESASFDLEEEAETGLNYFILVANGSESFSEPNYANNVFVLDFNLEETTQDLSITHDFTGDTLIIGQEYAIPYEIINHGLTDVGNVSRGLFVSNDTIYNEYDYDLISYYSNYLDSGAIHTGNFYFEINKLLPGDYYLIAMIDYDDAIDEINENNNKVVSSIHVTGSQADLITENIAVPVGISAGDNIPVSFDVKNNGTSGVFANTYAAVYLSSEPFINDLNQMAKGQVAVNTLEAGMSSSCTYDLSIPVLPTGTYYLHTVADAEEDMPEANEGNNSSFVEIQVVGYPVPVRSLSYTGESLCEAGEVTLTAGGASGSETYQWFNESGIILEVETNSTFTTFITKSTTFYVAIDSAGYYSEKTPVNATLVETVETDFHQNGYMLEVTDPAEGVTYNWYYENALIAEDSPSVSVATTLSGLYKLKGSRGGCDYFNEMYIHISYQDLISTEPLLENDTLQLLSVDNLITDTVINIGNNSAHGFYYEVFLSGDTIYDKDDIDLFSRYISSLDSMEKYPVQELVDLDLAVPRGQYYLLAIVDSREYVDEINEGNNMKVFPVYLVPPDIDLVPVNYVLQSDSVLKGEYFRVQTQVTNKGNLDLELSFELGFYLSMDTILDVLDYRFDYSNLNSLMAHDTSSVLYETHYMDFDPGNYHVLIKTDDDDEVPELNENNNIAVLPFTIFVHQGGDLFIQNAEFYSDTVVHGDEASLDVKIKNNGPEKTSAGEMHFYLSYDTLLDTEEDKILDWGYYTALESGESVVEYVYIRDYDYRLGINYVFCVLDPDDIQTESNEENNISYYSFTVVEDKSDFSISWEEAPGDTLHPWNSSLLYRIVNNGTGDSKRVYTHVYLSKDTVADYKDNLIYSTSYNLLLAWTWQIQPLQSPRSRQ